MSTDFPTAPLAPGHKGASGGAVEKSHHASHTKNLTLPQICSISRASKRCALLTVKVTVTPYVDHSQSL